MEQILSPANLGAAYRQVMRNKGAAGIDRMDCEHLLGIPTVVDRMVQQAIAQVLTHIYE